MSTEELSDRAPGPAHTPLPSARSIIAWGLVGLLVGFLIGAIGTVRRCSFGGPLLGPSLTFYGTSVVESDSTGKLVDTWENVLVVLGTSTGTGLAVGGCVLAHWFRQWLARNRRSETSLPDQPSLIPRQPPLLTRDDQYGIL